MEINGKYGTAIIYNDTVDPEELSQIYGLLNHPMADGAHICIMADHHAGAGCVIGYTAKLTDKIVPNLIGVDISCGVLTYKLGHESELNFKFEDLDAFIRENIPYGQTVHSDKLPIDINSIFNSLSFNINEWKNNIKEIAKRTGQSYDYILASLGTMGGNNHFLELDRDDNGYLYFTVHSGSRNFGLKIANYHQDIAKKRMFSVFYENEKEKIVSEYKNRNPKKIEEELSKLKNSIPKIQTGLEYLSGDLAMNYIHDAKAANIFASANRRTMCHIVIEKFFKINPFSLESIESIHNYINFDDNIIRKGAISAHKGEKLLIPLNMADGIILGIGKGNPEYNESAPHGCGRIMSRAKAKEVIDLKDYQKRMKDSKVWTSCVKKDTIDESPQSYKPAQEIIDLIEPTVEIVSHMIPVYNFKAN